jgi:hypothetical protein
VRRRHGASIAPHENASPEPNFKHPTSDEREGADARKANQIENDCDKQQCDRY